MRADLVKRIKELAEKVPASVMSMTADDLLADVLSVNPKHAAVMIEICSRWIQYGDTYIKHENMKAAGVIPRD